MIRNAILLFAVAATYCWPARRCRGTRVGRERPVGLSDRAGRQRLALDAAWGRGIADVPPGDDRREACRSSPTDSRKARRKSSSATTPICGNWAWRSTLASLGNEGYVIRTVGDDLVIAGGQLRGNMYGVYGFLEDHLGCRWFAPGVSRIPKSAAVGHRPDRRPPGSRAGVPRALPGRLSRRRLVRPQPHELQCARLDAKHGGKVKFVAVLVPHVRAVDAGGEIFQRASRVFLAGQWQAA